MRADVNIAEPSRQMAEVLSRLREEDNGAEDPTTLPPVQAREVAETANRRWNTDLPRMWKTEQIIFNTDKNVSVETRLFTPNNSENGLIIFIHGGGFSLCSIDTHERAARLLAEETSRATLSIDYRLAPEYPYPTGLNDCVSIFREIGRLQKADAWASGPIAIAGDSSGANLALAVMLNEQSEKRPLPDFAMLFYGVYGTNFQTESYLKFRNGPGLTRDKMMRYLDWYAPTHVREDPLVTPLNASDEALSALPPLYINAAEIDPLCSDTESLAARLRGLGRKDQVRIFNGVVHGFMQMTSCLEVAREATSEAASAFRKFAGTKFTNFKMEEVK